MQRDFRRQICALENLSTFRGGYEITEFRVEEWAGNHVNVRRVRVPLHCSKIAYHESYVIGPRGKLKEIYSNIY